MKSSSPFFLDRERLSILLIIILAWILRVSSIDFGLPHLYHADEPIVVHHALSYGTGDLNPHYFKLPPLISYLLFFCYGVYYLAARLTGSIANVAEFERLFFTDPTSFYLLGRMIFGAFLGTLTVLLFYLFCRRYFSKTHAFAASFLLAVNFLHVKNSHYLYLDIPLLCVILGSLFPIFRILETQLRKDYLLFGALHGLAVGVKYNGFFVVIPFLVAHVLSCGRDIKKCFGPKPWLAGLASIGVFLAVNPFALLDFPGFSLDLFSMHEYEGKLGWSHHLVYSLHGAVGLPVLLFAFLGIANAFLRFERNRFVLFSFALGYYAVLANFSEQHARYVLPLIPFILFFAVDGVLLLASRFPRLKFFFAAGLILLALPSLAKVYRCNWLLAQEDIRTVAMKWIEKNIPEGKRIALDSPFFMPRLLPSIGQLENKRAEAALGNSEAQEKRISLLIEEAKEKSHPRYELYFLNQKGDTEFLFAKPVAPYDRTQLRRLGIEYVMVVRLREGLLAAFYDELKESASLIKRFTPYRDPDRKWPVSRYPLTGAPFLWDELWSRERNGQIIEIYEL